VGKAIKRELDQHQDSNCLCHAEVTSLQEMEGGAWAISIKPDGLVVGRLPREDHLVNYIKEGNKIHAKSVVLACGGRQMGPQFKGQYQGLEDKMLLSDRVLRLSGLEQLQEKIEK